MSNTFTNTINKENIEEYKSLKKKAKEQILRRDFYYGRDLLIQAYELFKQDAEVCNMLGYCAYKISNIDEALKFYKLAYEIDSTMFQVNLNIGRILLEKEKYSEAVYYFQEYMSEADKNNIKDNKAKVLRHLGYCYYYMNDFMNAKYYFNESYKLDSNNKYTNNFLKNVKKRLEGKKARQIDKYEEFYDICNNPNDHNTYSNDTYVKKDKKSSKTGMPVKTIISLILTLISIIAYVDKNDVANKKEKSETSVSDSVSINSKNSNKTSSTDYFVNSIEEYQCTYFNMPVSMKLDKLERTNYYELSEAVHDKVLYSKEEVDRNNWWDNVECRLYIGNFNGWRVVCSIPMGECDKAEKKGKVTICGAKHEMNNEIENELRDNIVNGKMCLWASGVYLTSQKNFIDEAEKLKKQSYVNNEGKTVKVIKTEKEFLDNNYGEVQSIYLTEILPLDYFQYRTSEHESRLLTLEELKAEKINPDSCIRMYAGKIGDLEIGFADPDFSMGYLDDNGGYWVEGTRLYNGRTTLKVNVQGNYAGKSSVDMYWCYMEAKR